MATCLEETSCKYNFHSLQHSFRMLSTLKLTISCCSYQSNSVGPGPPDESVAQQKDEATAENNAISNSSSDYMACIQRNRECIEKGTDAQVIVQLNLACT